MQNLSLLLTVCKIFLPKQVDYDATSIHSYYYSVLYYTCFNYLRQWNEVNWRRL